MHTIHQQKQNKNHNQTIHQEKEQLELLNRTVAR
jgi:hypothetical protein